MGDPILHKQTTRTGTPWPRGWSRGGPTQWLRRGHTMPPPSLPSKSLLWGRQRRDRIQGCVWNSTDGQI